MKAPAFPAKATWLNTAEPLSLEQLRGHVLVLDFWTYCCINCMHVLPVLEKFEHALANEPVHVIGVHAAKFDQEKDAANIRRAVDRHGVKHPVLVDSDHELWQQFAVRAWPTLVLVDGEGKIFDQIAGEPNFEDLLRRVQTQLDVEKTRGTLAGKKLEVLRPAADTGRALSFPGKARVLHAGKPEEGNRLAIADTGHHRVLLGDLSLESGWPKLVNIQTIGGGGVGQQDGNFESASFRRPQGMTLLGETLYVCDTENYLLRAADLKTKQVRTVAGSGEITGTPDWDNALATPLRSPWDALTIGEAVLIAVAGSHQLWAYDPAAARVFPVVGSGREDHIDGGFAECALAQPSSLAYMGPYIVFADSEVSSIRVVDFRNDQVFTVMGRGLFDFGDEDGPTNHALLQHPLGVVAHPGGLFVADTFNNKLKRIDLEKRTVETWLGDGSPGQLCEPGGIDTTQDFLYVADTNNHRVLVVKIADREVRELGLRL